MVGRTLSTLTVFLCMLTAAAAQTSPEDRAAANAMERSDRALGKVKIWRRTAISDRLDLVLMIGGASGGSLEGGAVEWSEQRTLGLYLQDRQNPGRVYLIDKESGEPDCQARIERITDADAFISCTSDRQQRPRYQKFVYDPRAKTLVHRFRYAAFSAYRIFPRQDRAIFIAGDNERLLAVEYRAEREPLFRVLDEAAARPWLARVHTEVETEGAKPVLYIEPEKAPVPPAVPKLPRTTYDQFAAARPRRVKDGYVRASTEIHESIGPWQREDGRIWFGKYFYDGEGSSGVGGFGYFDLKARQLRMFEPPEIADWSVTAMAVGPEAVWMGVAWLGEGSNLSGGLLRFERKSETTRRLDYPDLARAMARLGDELLIASDFGFGIVRGDRVSRYFVDRKSDGQYRVLEAAGKR